MWHDGADSARRAASRRERSQAGRGDRAAEAVEGARLTRPGGGPRIIVARAPEGAMPVVIPDDVLREAGLDERGALVEFACRLFDAGKLTLPSATKMAGLGRLAFEQELIRRKIAIYRPTIEELTEELAAMERLGI